MPLLHLIQQKHTYLPQKAHYTFWLPQEGPGSQELRLNQAILVPTTLPTLTCQELELSIEINKGNAKSKSNQQCLPLRNSPKLGQISTHSIFLIKTDINPSLVNLRDKFMPWMDTSWSAFMLWCGWTGLIKEIYFHCVFPLVDPVHLCTPTDNPRLPDEDCLIIYNIPADPLTDRWIEINSVVSLGCHLARTAFWMNHQGWISGGEPKNQLTLKQNYNH